MKGENLLTDKKKKGGIKMKKTRHLIIGAIIFSFIVIASSPSYAGCRQRYRWEGIGIALGSMALLGTLYSWTHPHFAAPAAPACPPAPRYYSPPPRTWVPGHWEITRERRAGYWERVWVSGHYDRYGRWVTGHYIRRHVPVEWIEHRM